LLHLPKNLHTLPNSDLNAGGRAVDQCFEDGFFLFKAIKLKHTYRLGIVGTKSQLSFVNLTDRLRSKLVLKIPT
jgi:hypothetical protein